MKRFFTILFLSALSLSFAQEVEDSISMQPGYTNDVFYSLENGEVSAYSGSSWTVAFYNNAMSAAIMINDGRGVELFKVTDDISQFANITDTIGLSTWTQLYGTNATWRDGSAFEGETTGSPFNYGWGDYDLATKVVSGSRIFMIKTIEDAYYKVYVVKKETGIVTYRYASLDNSFDTTMVINVPDYLNKSYAYLNMDNHTLQDREPNGDEWDFVFTRYVTFVTNPQGSAYYPVVGVFSNEGVEVAEVNDIPANADYAGAPFSGARNVIGDDWKSFDPMAIPPQFVLNDSLTYYVQNQVGDIYKLYFTRFDGSSTGNVRFNKEKVASGTTSIRDNQPNLDVHTIYPNPSKGSVDLVFSSEEKEKLNLRVYSLLGKLVINSEIVANLGLNSIRLNLNDVENGVYLVQLGNDINTATHKLIVNK